MRSVLLALALIGCDSPQPNDLRLPYLGMWSNTGGTVSASCNGMTPQESTLNAGQLQFTISKGTFDNVLDVAFTEPPDCHVEADVIADSASTAIIPFDNACTIMGGTLTFRSNGTFSTTDGVALTAVFTSVSDDGGSNVCTQMNMVPLKHP